LSSDEIQRWGRAAMDIEGCCLGLKQLGLGEDVRSLVTPIKCVHSLGILGDESGKRTHEACNWLGKRR
jgi:hypothetical protein